MLLGIDLIRRVLIGINMNNFILDLFILIGYIICLLYTSDAADERSSVDLGGRRIIKKKNRINSAWGGVSRRKNTE